MYKKIDLDLQNIITDALKEMKSTLQGMQKEIELDNYRKALKEARTEAEYYQIKAKITRLSTFVNAGTLDIDYHKSNNKRLEEKATEVMQEYAKSCIILEFLKGIQNNEDVVEIEKKLRRKYK